MSSSSPFFILPCEVRLTIYHAYFALADGYIPSSDLRGLRTSSGEPIQLHLMYTCKRIAQETQGLPLSLNTLTFSTLDSDYFNLAALRFAGLQPELQKREEELLRKFSCLIDSHLYTEVANEFPIFKAALDDLTYRNRSFKDGLRVRSVYNQATSHLFRLLISVFASDIKPQVEELSPAEYIQETYCTLWKMSNIRHAPWSIPTWDELDQMSAVIPREYRHFSIPFSHFKCPLKISFSAAAASIAFLNSTPRNTRDQIRHIVLNEDNPGAVFPASHGQGLIPFCQENPHLRIERRINIWRACFSWHYNRSTTSLLSNLDSLSFTMAEWLAEAMALVPSGMPPDSMVTFFDGNPAPEACSLIFRDAIQRDLAYLRLLKIPQIYERPHYPYYHPCNDVYHYSQRSRTLTVGLQHLANPSGTIRCNFDPGETQSLEQENHSIDLVEWCSIWVRREPFSFALTPTFANLHEFLQKMSPTFEERERMREYAERVQFITREEHEYMTEMDLVWT